MTEQPPMELTPDQQHWLQARRERAFRLLAAREHSRNELREKLLRNNGRDDLPEDDTPLFTEPEQATNLIEQLLDQLAEQQLQSDRRFLDSLVRQYLSRGKGPLALQQACRQHRLDPAAVNETLQHLEKSWPRQIQRVKEKRFGNEPPADVREAARMQRFLAQRGFTPEQIRKAVTQRRG